VGVKRPSDGPDSPPTGPSRTWPAPCIRLRAISISQLVLNEIAWSPGDPGTGAPSLSHHRNMPRRPPKGMLFRAAVANIWLLLLVLSPPPGLARRPGLIRDPGFSESRHRSHRGNASRGGIAEINRWSDGAWLSCHFKTWLSDRAAFLNELCSTGIATYLRNMLSNAAMGHVLRHNALSRIDAPTKVQREARIWRGRSNESSGKQGLLLAAEQTSRLRIWGSGVQISSGAPLNV
jgi:hypothetical protein